VPCIKAWVERYEAAARQALSREAADAAWTEGQAMTLEKAIAYALNQESD